MSAISYNIKSLMAVAKKQHVKLVSDPNDMNSDVYLEILGWAHVSYHDSSPSNKPVFDGDTNREQYHDKDSIVPLVLNSEGTGLEPVLVTADRKLFRGTHEFRGVVDNRE